MYYKSSNFKKQNITIVTLMTLMTDDSDVSGDSDDSKNFGTKFIF